MSVYLDGVKDGSSVSAISVYDATVGTSNADYADISAAIADGKSSLLLVTDVTEDSDIALVGDLFIDLDTFQLSLGTFQFTYDAVYNVSVLGRGSALGAEISWAHAAADQVFENSTQPTSVTKITGCVLDNNSVAAATHVSDGIEEIEDVVMELPDNIQGGFVGGVGSTYRNIQLIGGGSSCTLGLKYTGGSESIASDIFVTGEFSSSGIAIDLEDGLAGGFLFDVNTGSSLLMTVDTMTLSNVINRGAVSLDITCISGACHLSNIRMLSGDLDVGNTVEGQFSNVKSSGLLDMTDAAVNNNLFHGCKFDTALVVAGDRNKFEACDFEGGITVNAGADDNGFVNCQAGADAGGGAGTITIAATSNRTRVVGCMTDAAISDSGTGSVLAGNSVY